MAWRLVAAVFETDDGELVTCGDAPSRWAAKVADGNQAYGTEVTLGGCDIDWWVSFYEAETLAPNITWEEFEGSVHRLHHMREVRAEARRILATYAPLREKAEPVPGNGGAA